MELQLLTSDLLLQYLQEVPTGLSGLFDALKDAELSTKNFSFYTSVASVYSSKIEGENIDLDSYIKHRRNAVPFLPDYTRKTDDLYNAYQFAQQSELHEKNLKAAHSIISNNLLPVVRQGKYRTQNMFVTTAEGRIEYVAALPADVPALMKKFFFDLKSLMTTKLSIEEVFCYATMLHLHFVKIHPWMDGNGRCARLLEKWFIAQKLGAKAWFVESEKMYYEHHQQYYRNLQSLGLEFQELNYALALPFLLMLPSAL